MLQSIQPRLRAVRAAGLFLEDFYSELRTRLQYDLRIQQLQEGFTQYQKALEAAQLQVDDILSQLDEHYHKFVSLVPGKTPRDCVSPCLDLLWAKRAHGQIKGRLDDAKVEQKFNALVEDLLRRTYEREVRRHPKSDLAIECRRRWLRARNASQSARNRVDRCYSELDAISAWHDRAQGRTQEWEEQQRPNRKQKQGNTTDRHQTRKERMDSKHRHEHKRWRKADHTGNQQQNAYEHVLPPGQSSKPIKPETSVNPIAKWRNIVEAAFADYSTMRSFPTPPATRCKELNCRDQRDRALEVCECSVRKAFEHTADLKTERLKWHPDRFGVCSEGNREVFVKKAEEVFVVVNAMYEHQKDRQNL